MDAMSSKGGDRHRQKDDLDVNGAHRVFELRSHKIKNLGIYETVPRSGAIDGNGLRSLTSFLLDMLMLRPSAAPKRTV